MRGSNDIGGRVPQAVGNLCQGRGKDRADTSWERRWGAMMAHFADADPHKRG